MSKSDNQIDVDNFRNTCTCMFIIPIAFIVVVLGILFIYFFLILCINMSKTVRILCKIYHIKKNCRIYKLQSNQEQKALQSIENICVIINFQIKMHEVLIIYSFADKKVFVTTIREHFKYVILSQ